MQDHVTRLSRSATPTPAICIEPDALDINLTATILNFDENEVVTSDTAIAKARSSGVDQVVISYSDEDSIDGLDDVAPDNIEAALSSEGATGNADNDNVSVQYSIEDVYILTKQPILMVLLLSPHMVRVMKSPHMVRVMKILMLLQLRSCSSHLLAWCSAIVSRSTTTVWHVQTFSVNICSPGSYLAVVFL